MNAALLDVLSRVLNKHIAPIFKDGTKLTLIARTPGNPEADVLVTTEPELDEVIALVERSKARDVVGPATLPAPKAAEPFDLPTWMEEHAMLEARRLVSLPAMSCEDRRDAIHRSLVVAMLYATDLKAKAGLA